MNKNEALKSAIQALENIITEYKELNITPPLQALHAIQDCKKALELSYE
jgi:hypothetical protein